MKSVVRRVVAAGACCGLLTAGVYAALRADAAVAVAPPAEVTVVPADPTTDYLVESVHFAGATGFLHRYYSPTSPVLWTRYADGATTAIPELATADLSSMLPAGGDVVRTAQTVPGHSAAGQLTVLDLATMAWRQVPLPSDAALLGYYGDAMVVRAGAAQLSLRRFAADGTATTTPVSGIPAGTTSITTANAGDATTMVLRLVVAGQIRYSLLDLSAGDVTLLPVQPMTVRTVLLTNDRVGLVGGPAGGEVVVRSYARATITDEPEVVRLPERSDLNRIVLVGSHVIASAGDDSAAPAIDYSAAGATVVKLVQPRSFSIVQNGDGAILVGGTGPADWSVRRLTAGGQTVVLPLTGPLTNAGVSISQGVVRHIEAQRLPGDPAVRYLMFNHEPSAAADAGHLVANGGFLTAPVPCDDAAACARTVDGNGYGTSYLSAGPTATTSVLRQRIDVNTGPMSMTIPSAAGRIVDASLRYVVVNGANPAKQYVVRPGYDDPAPIGGPIAAATLWFNTMWTSPKPGYLQAKDLPSGKASAAVPTGAPCTATELQATARYVYWACGADGPAGVYDPTRKASVAVPAGHNLLGDGYVVRHEPAGNLVRYDLATGTSATVAAIGHGGVADDRGITWAVDRFGGNIAYVDAENAVHVVDPGTIASPPAALLVDSYPFDGWVEFAPYGEWVAYIYLSRPVLDWKLTVTQVSTGKVVGTRTGGPNRTWIYTTWDGYLAGKKKAASGHYRYALTVTATAGAAPVTIASGTLLANGGTPNLHSYENTGQPSVLGLKSSGEGHWLIATSGAYLHDQGMTEHWWWGKGYDAVSAMVPFGDVNNDGYNDLIARSGTGYLRAYLGIGQSHFGGRTAVVLGSGWNQYNAILTSGDLTGDGIADLLARDKNGKIWRYNGTGKKTLAARVALAGTYKSYARVIGPGDLNGDGRADLLVVSAGGYMYAANGTGKGTFGALHVVSSGWKGYNLVISAGDVNEDSHPDLMARDPAGVLWRFLGTGKGGFAARQKVGTGYQKYSRIF
jgi:hypothetical protein